MIQPKYLLVSVFLTVFLANSYSWGFRETMWPIKFGVLFLFFIYILNYVLRFHLYFNVYLPKHNYALLGLFSIVTLVEAYFVDASQYNIDAQHSYTLLAGIIVIVYFSSIMACYLSIEENQQALLFGVVNSAAIVTISNIVLYLAGINLGRGAHAGLGFRFSGWLDNPNTLGVILLGGFPFVLISVLGQNSRISYEKVLLVLMMVLVILTGSRSATVGIFIISSLLLWTHSKKFKTISVVLGFMGLILLFFEVNPGSLEETIPQFFRSGDEVLSGRTDVWDLGWSLFLEQPWAGYGFGSEKMLIEAHLLDTSVHQGEHFHNSYLSLLLSSGLLGAVPMFLLILIALKAAIFNIFLTDAFNDSFRDLMSALFIGLLFNAYFETWIFSPGSVYFFVFWSACFWLLLEPRYLQDSTLANGQQF